jgi:hypothetical protein
VGLGWDFEEEKVMAMQTDRGSGTLALRLDDTGSLVRVGAQAIFRMRPVATAYNILINLDRKERAILLLLDGQRTLQDVARLTHRSDLEVAQVLARLLRRGLVEYFDAQ